MKESSKVLIGLGLGLVAGGVAGYFLSSEEGRKFQRKTKKQLAQLSEDVKNKVKDNANAASEKISSATTSAKDWAAEVSEAVKQKISRVSNSAEEMAEDAADDFQSGVDRARKTIKAKTDTFNGAADKA